MGKAPNLYNVGDLIRIDGFESWMRIKDVHIYINISEDEEDSYTEVTYGCFAFADGSYLDVDEEEVKEVRRNGVKPVKQTKQQKINELLDLMLMYQDLNKVTNNAFAGEYEKVKAELALLTKAGE